MLGERLVREEGRAHGRVGERREWKPLFLNSGLGKIEVINHWISIQGATDKKKRARAHLVARALFFLRECGDEQKRRPAHP